MKKQLLKFMFKITYVTILASLLSANVFADGRDEDKDGDKAHHVAPCSGFRTFSQEKWASSSSKQAASVILASNFSTVFPSGLTVGGTKKIMFTNFTAVRGFLNQSSGSKALTSALVTNPTKSSLSNKLAAELVAATLNIQMDLQIASFATSTQNLKDLKIGKGDFKNWTVEQVVAEANKVLGGGSSNYSVSKLAKAIENINDSYNDSEKGHDSDSDDDDDHSESNLVCPIVFSSTVTNVSCKGANNGSINITDITGGRDDRYTISWSTGAKTNLISGLSAGTYTVTITDKKGINVIKSITISEPELLTSNSSTLPILCKGDSAEVTITANGGTTPYTGTGTYKVPAGTYTYTVTDANGCSTSTEVVVTEPTQLVSSSSATTILCHGGSATIRVSAEGGVGPYSGTGDYTVVAGEYTYTVTDANGCASSTTITVVEPTELKSNSSATTILCHGGSATVTVTAEGGVGPYSGTGEYTVVAGEYTYTVTDSNGCTSSTTITVVEPTELKSNSSATTILCNGGSATVTVSAEGGVGPYSGTGEFTVVAGEYTYTVTDSNGCSSSTTITVVEPDKLEASSSSTTIACKGESATITVSAVGGVGPYTGTGEFTVQAGKYSYTVTDSNGCTSTTEITVTEPEKLVAKIDASSISCNGDSALVIVSATGGTQPYVGTGSFYEKAGTFTYTVTDANGCTSTDTFTLTQPTALSLTGTVKNDNSCNSGSCSGVAKVVATGGTSPYTYTWTNATSSTDSATGLCYNVIPSVTVTDANGCSKSYIFDTVSCVSTVASCDPLLTYTQSSYGSESTTAAKTYLINNFSTAFPNGLTIGTSSKKIVFNTAAALIAFLPCTEDGGSIPSGTLTNPTLSTYNSKTAGELVAAILNVTFDDVNANFASPSHKLKNMYCNVSPYKGKTVEEVIQIASAMMGGTNYSSDNRDKMRSVLKKLNAFYSTSTSSVDNTDFLCEKPSSSGSSDGHGDRAAVSTTSSDFNVYPNPAVNNFTVNFSSTVATVGTLKLYNLAGQLISEEMINVTEGANYYEVELASKSINANMIVVEVKYNDIIKHTLLVVK